VGYADAAYRVTTESLETYHSRYMKQQESLNWDCLFVTPPWVRVWLDHFKTGAATHFLTVHHGGTPVGIAPLLVRHDCASLIGGADVCDYLDAVISPGYESVFFTLIIEHLIKKGIATLDLGPLHETSPMLAACIPAAETLGLPFAREEEDVLFEMELPSTWPGFLNSLNRKQRHEVRRKIRRLHESGRVTFRMLDDSDGITAGLDVFFTLFRSNRTDKAAFMTDRMAAYFCDLAGAMAGQNILRLGILELDTRPVAAVMCFEYRGMLFLYNSGYDSRYSPLNVGTVSKIFSIKEAVRRGLKKYSFLKGAEVYKQRLGGKQVKLFRFRICLR